jgi:hypothetical protein
MMDHNIATWPREQPSKEYEEPEFVKSKVKTL